MEKIEVAKVTNGNGKALDKPKRVSTLTVETQNSDIPVQSESEQRQSFAVRRRE